MKLERDMSSLLDSPGSAVRDLDRNAIRPLRFSSIARQLATVLGRPATFFVAVLGVVVWAATGPLFDYSDTWQLVIDTSTTIITFLMVFLIQNTQNRDTEAMQIKLDELVRATQGAHNALLNLEHLEDEELARYRRHYAALARVARKKLRDGELDTDSPEIKNFGKRGAARARARHRRAPRPARAARARTGRRSGAARAAGGGTRGRHYGSARQAGPGSGRAPRPCRGARCCRGSW